MLLQGTQLIVTIAIHSSKAKQKDSLYPYDIREMQAPLIVPSSEATQEIAANQPNTDAVHVRLQPGLGLNNGQGNNGELVVCQKAADRLPCTNPTGCLQDNT